MPTLAPKMWSVNKAQVKVNAQMMYEALGESYDKIGASLGVAVATLKQWALKDGWRGNKGVLVPKINEFTRQSFIEMAAKQGLPPERVVQVLIEGMTQANKDYVVGEKDGQIQTLYEGKPDHAVRHKYVHEYMLATGAIGSGQSNNLNINGEGAVNVQINMPSKKKPKADT